LRLLLGESQLSGYSESSARRQSALRTFRTWFAIQLSETDALKKPRENLAKEPFDSARQGGQSLFRIAFESIEYFKKNTPFPPPPGQPFSSVDDGLQGPRIAAKFVTRPQRDWPGVRGRGTLVGLVGLS